jgi:ribosomal protein L7/L12
MVDKTPCVLKTQVHILEAEEVKAKLSELGAIIEF